MARGSLGNGQLEAITPPPVTPADDLVIRRTYYGPNDPDGGSGLLKSIQLWQGATADSQSLIAPQPTYQVWPSGGAANKASNEHEFWSIRSSLDRHLPVS